GRRDPGVTGTRGWRGLRALQGRAWRRSAGRGWCRWTWDAPFGAPYWAGPTRPTGAWGYYGLMIHGNLLSDLPSSLSHELFTTLVRADAVRIERIVSLGHAWPPGFWYDQEENEFVLLVHGGARLDVEGRGAVALGPGDWIDLPAHVRHRVSFINPAATT